MLRSTALSGLLLLALATQGCDVGGKTVAPTPADPSSLEIGDDSDIGTDDMGPTPVDLHGQLHVSGTELHDASDNRVQLKGVSSMWLNWENDGYAESLAGLKWLRNNWHLSVIRAAMGVDPKGAYLTDPDKAKAQVQQIVDNAIAAGVYVLIDWHTENANQQTEQSVAFFTEMATKYAGIPNVLYEPFNEPTKLDWTTVLKPYHEAVVAAIRAVEPDSVIILGTSTWSQDVDIAAKDPVIGKNLMYTLHFYACDHGSFLISKAKVALTRGAPLFVTEWGATKADGGLDGTVCLPEAQTWMDFLNEKGISWAAWKFDNCTPDSTCFLTPDAPINGGWTSEYLQGEGLFVRARMQD
ncbi:MAG: glycoside hydrolase family 5 protein [Pseudomonadota bacterium]